ncbi:Diaminopropionate ammonia-lyase [Arsenophonus endosymbiont of Aleurodicus floccissimus]|nr:Diaminopropionate ammonia-lyase [Arsenophonus endosymbiont of Aleurodicus floccissimus]
MSIFSLKLDIAQNRFFTDEKSDLFSRQQARKAGAFHQKINKYYPTPLYSLDGLADLFQVGKILVKDESQRFGLNAFKMLGSTYAIRPVIV